MGKRAGRAQGAHEERLMRGVGAAPGVATGQAMVLGALAAIDAKPIPEAERASELVKARAALAAAADELESIATTLRDGGRSAEADIVETGILMAHDPELSASVERLVIESGLIAAVALRTA